MGREKVYLGMPAGGHVNLEAVKGFFTSSCKHDVVPVAYNISALASCFNHLWAEALVQCGKGNITHFAMLHSDIGPKEGWLDSLIDELQKNKLDMVASVMPIKNGDGLTSTAVGAINDSWSQKRLTMTEVDELPMTFTDKDLVQWKIKHKREGHVLLLNTGCWVCDLRRPQWHEVDAQGNLKFCFTQNDRITVDQDGKLFVGFAPEDWLWSRACHRAGLKIGATKIVKAWHFGNFPYYNQGAWGELTEDKFK